MARRTRLDRVTGAFLRVFDSPKLFWIFFGVFLAAALFMAISGIFSMAYDEYVHLGIARLYTHQWSPFFSSQPASTDIFGVITRDPSYLYHFLISFPLRIFAHFCHAFMAQVIFLRLFSIAFFAIGLLLFRAAFQRAGVPLRVRNLALCFFMVIPVVPFAAAQINYDTMLFMMVGLTVWLAVGVSRSLRIDKKFPTLDAIWLTVTVLLASLVKYAFLPILLALTVYFGVVLYRLYGWRLTGLGRQARRGLIGVSRWRLYLAVALLLLSAGLFGERYGVNMVRYHTPTPECNQVVSVERCQAYEPFARNYAYTQGHYPLPAYKVYAYPFNNWMRGMMRSLFFVVGNKETGYEPGEPLPMAYVGGYAVIVGGLLLTLIRLRWLWRRSHTNQLFMVIGGTYAGLLFVQNFMDFLHTHVPVAIQGRYLLPILPLFLVVVAQTALDLLRRLQRPKISAALLAILCILLLEGGSFLPFIIRGRDEWFWNAPLIQHANKDIRAVLTPFIVKN